MRMWHTSLACASVLCPLFLNGCGGNGNAPPPAGPIAVSLYVTGTDVDAGESQAVMASLSNDASEGGVTWSLSGDGTLTLPTQTFATSPKFQCFYNAPTIVPTRTTATLLAVAAHDSTKTASVTFTLYPNLKLTTDTLPQAQAGKDYSFQLTASGGKGPLNYVVVNAPLPAGLTLSQNGLLSGIPTTPGSYSLTLQVQDITVSSLAAATGTFSFQVI